ncbi:hypothetical protein MJO28_013320 [Puccinia striiformis f. sp. tritici]|uniref:Uncharacterized protein n=1 Tax=Puccinia striiformis f. sp. tritici TaxID=168172 RepID=A0ACC0DZ71_9BASI|nr:hypothetical protein MJO28_013320 [Puccinia striiformis f. sp. tritici]
MKNSSILTTSDFSAAANNLPLVLDSASRPFSWSPSATPAGPCDLAVQRSEHLKHRWNFANGPVINLEAPKRICPPLDWSSLSFNQLSNSAAHASNQSGITSSQFSTNWLPIGPTNIPAVLEKTEHQHLATQDTAPITELSSESEEITGIPLMDVIPKTTPSNPENETSPPLCPSDLNQSSSRTPLNRSVRFSDPTPLGIQTDETKWLHDFSMDKSYKKVDPFPSPRFGRASMDASYQSPRKASLPDWVVREYLTSITLKKLEPSGTPKPLQANSSPTSRSNQLQHKDSSRTGSGTHRSATNFTLDTLNNSRLSSISPPVSSTRHVPPPGKVFYPLLDHSQVRKYNKNNHCESLSLSPKLAIHSSTRLQNVDPNSITKNSIKSRIRQLFVFKKNRRNSSRLPLS